MANPAAVNLSDNHHGVDHISAAAVLDLVHLSRQTFGDHALETELLTLFDRQTAQFAGRLATPRSMGDTGARIDLAHMLRGSARTVGAFAVAAAAESYETALRRGEAREAECCAKLLAEIDAARKAIADIL